MHFLTYYLTMSFFITLLTHKLTTMKIDKSYIIFSICIEIPIIITCIVLKNWLAAVGWGTLLMTNIKFLIMCPAQDKKNAPKTQAWKLVSGCKECRSSTFYYLTPKCVVDMTKRVVSCTCEGSTPHSRDYIFPSDFVKYPNLNDI